MGNQTKTKRNKGVAFAITLAIVAGLIWGLTSLFNEQYQRINKDPEDQATDQIEQRIMEILDRPDFKETIRDEVIQRLYEGMIEDSTERLEKLRDEGERNTYKLQAYLSARNPRLVQYADYIVTLPRWKLAVGIISKETGYCQAGVGASRNNCGAIKNGKGNFKHYNNHLESIEDVTILLQHDRYRDKSINEINGVYCQDVNRPGRKCEGWTEHVTQIVQELS